MEQMRRRTRSTGLVPRLPVEVLESRGGRGKSTRGSDAVVPRPLDAHEACTLERLEQAPPIENVLARQAEILGIVPQFSQPGPQQRELAFLGHLRDRQVAERYDGNSHARRHVA